MEEKVKALLVKWQAEQDQASIMVKHFVEKYQFGEAQKQQTKAVWLEHCIMDLQHILNENI